MSTQITVNANVRVVDVSVTYDGNTVLLQPVLTINTGGGGGAVTSVNGQIGAVLLDADDISDLATTNKYTTQADIDRLANTSGTNTGDQVLPTNTSDLINDGADGVNPFITAVDVSTPTLQEVTDVGNVTNNTITVNSLLITGIAAANMEISPVGSTYRIIRGADNVLNVGTSNTDLYGKVTLNYNSLSTQRTFNFPDKSGTIAMLDDITAGAVDSVNGQTGVVVLDTDDIADTATNRYTNDTDITRLSNTSGTNTGDQLEQDIVSTLIEPTIIAGAYTFDVSTGRAFKFSITENTTLTPPTLTNGTALSFTAIVTGAFTLTAASTNITPTSDAYNGAVENRLIYDCYRTGAGVQTNILTIENLA